MSRIGYLGNFGVSYSTESHVALSLEDLGHEVIRLQEGEVRATDVPDLARGCDLFLWTQTYGFAVTGGTKEDRWAMLAGLSGIPTVGFHLDLWWGLKRQVQIAEREPFFHVDTLYTSDGGHDAEWAAAGVNHYWSPPAVYGGECYLADPHPAYRSDVAFVGSWKGYNHEEHWPARRAMLAAVKRRYRGQFAMHPRGPAVRGADLNRLFASVKVVVGDSCLAGQISRYVSDRVFETIGRGGVLVHPRVEGVTDGGLLTEGEHLLCFDAGDHDEMLHQIDYLLTHDEEREAIRWTGMQHVKAHHTYAHRMQRVLSEVTAGVPM